MKAIVLLFFSSISFLYNSNLNAQNYLTFRQEYDYNVGDIFETKNCSEDCSSPPTYELTIILSKTYSTARDTIFYIDSLVFYTLPGCMICNPTFSTRRNYFSVTNLDSASTDFSFLYGNSCPVKDTLIDSGFCSRRMWEKYPVCPDTAFEPVTSSSWIIEGCGGGYFTSFDPSGP